MAERALIQCDSRTCRTIQQTFEMKACELILRLLSNVSGECRNGVWIAGFELGKGIHVAFGGGIIVLIGSKGLEYTQRRGLAPSSTPIGRPRNPFT